MPNYDYKTIAFAVCNGTYDYYHIYLAMKLIESLGADQDLRGQIRAELETLGFPPIDKPEFT